MGKCLDTILQRGKDAKYFFSKDEKRENMECFVSGWDAGRERGIEEALERKTEEDDLCAAWHDAGYIHAMACIRKDIEVHLGKMLKE
jgi:hypothetical protein